MTTPTEQVTTPKQFVRYARDRGDWVWVFFHIMTQADRDAFDQWLVDQKHPLAFTGGTQEHRFRTVVASEYNLVPR